MTWDEILHASDRTVALGFIVELGVAAIVFWLVFRRVRAALAGIGGTHNGGVAAPEQVEAEELIRR
jgi:hypothetical protein